MNRFARGIIAGSLMGLAAAAIGMSDKKSRRNAMRSGKNALKKAEDLMEDVRDMF
ncbi:hypothetical protein [Anaeropeptidivorans aminofermentans]|jgi:hypothetical protein|uniref:hypothetical protein n=1 Tax=Anaeropeptidivorans aminofermentans TaxID=2934315 RepID=UPI002025A1F3|nr:hypothetical protein [Anaeropeptidivorans aminofermentans]